MKVSIIMGNESDQPIMEEAAKILKEYGVSFEYIVFDPQQMNDQLSSFTETASNDGTKLIIAGAGGNFNFVTQIANSTAIPVIGIPMRSQTGGNDLASVFSIMQQPLNAPIATVALDSGQNAGILAVQILGTMDASLMNRIIEFKENLKNKILKANEDMKEIKFDYRIS